VTRHPPDAPRPVYDGAFVRYVIGRPALLIVWGVALWGTLAAARLLWIAATRTVAEAARLLGDSFVLIPVLIAVAMWSALGLTLGRRSRG
jgi:hypothetical protein